MKDPTSNKMFEAHNKLNKLQDLEKQLDTYQAQLKHCDTRNGRVRLEEHIRDTQRQIRMIEERG